MEIQLTGLLGFAAPVLRRISAGGAAERSAREALALYERKGNRPSSASTPRLHR
jgi:hypothetical protein